jgi:hypothetical protein
MKSEGLDIIQKKIPMAIGKGDDQKENDSLIQDDSIIV